MSLSFFLARRLQGGNRRDRFSRPAIRVATAGVAIGLVVMIVSVCVIMGFKHAIRDKVAGFGSHMLVSNVEAWQTGTALPLTADDSLMRRLEAMPDVRHVQRVSVKEGVLKTDADFLGVSFKGVDEHYDSTFLSQCLVAGRVPAFSSEKSSNKVVLSEEIANKLQLKVGDKVYAYFLSDKGLRPRRFTVEAVYATHVKYFDETTCFIDRYTVNRLHGWQATEVSHVEMLTEHFELAMQQWSAMARLLQGNTDSQGRVMMVQTIQQLYPQIFSWLDLLDINVWIILALMVALSAFTMISGLLIIILERTQMIGTLKALGARNTTIRHIFLWFAVFVVGRGLLIGNVIGLVLCFAQQLTHAVSLNPTNYYIDYVPIEVNLFYVLLLNVATLLVCVAVLVVPSFLVSRIHPARSIRFE